MKEPDLMNKLDAHFQFVANSVKCHTWPDELKQRLQTGLQRLQTRLNDKCANISIVGEFSVGKSSFLNALLGIDLLETDEMPDTTLVPAILFYSPQFSFQIIRTRGPEKKEIMTLQELKARLREYVMPELIIEDSGDEENMARLKKLRENTFAKSADIVQFNIGVPSYFLEKGFRLIDTPGLSSQNKKCAELALNMMQRTDTSIIIGDATKGILTQSLCEQFTQTLGKKLEDCIMIFSRYDRITPSRREKVRSFLEASTRSNLNVGNDKMAIFMAVPPTVQAQRDGYRFGDEHEEMLRITQKSLKSIERIAEEKRDLYIAKGLYKLFDQIYTHLLQRVVTMQSELKANLEELERSRTASLSDFITERKKHHTRKLATIKLELWHTLSDTLDCELKKLKKECDDQVFHKQDSARKLKKYLKETLSTDIKEQLEPLNKKAIDAYEQFVESRNRALKEFEKELNKEFARLSIIPVDFKAKSRSDLTFQPPCLKKSVDEMIGRVDYQIREDVKTSIAAIVGGAIGSVFGLGLGTVIGAGIGTAIFGSEKLGIEGVRENVKPAYEKSMEQNLSSIKWGVLNSFSQSVEDSIVDFSHHLDKYNERYKSAIDRLIVENNRERARTQDKIKRFQTELIKIYDRQNEIKEICRIN